MKRTNEDSEMIRCRRQIAGCFFRAGEGTRTLDIQLGKLALYQLSYARDSLSVAMVERVASRLLSDRSGAAA